MTPLLPLPPLSRSWWPALPVILAGLATPWLAGGWSHLVSQFVALAAEPGAAAASAPETAPPPPVVDIFAVRTWEPPPPPPVADTGQPPPPPEPPPLPFTYLGRIVEPDQAAAFLLRVGTRVMSVHVGDAIDREYKLEKYQDGKLVFYYRPMKVRQVLEIGARS